MLDDLKDSDKFVGRHLLLDVQTRSGRGINETDAIYRMLENLPGSEHDTGFPPLVARFPFAANELEQFVNSLTEEGIQARTISTFMKLLEQRNSENTGISGVTVWLESHAPSYLDGREFLFRCLFVQGLRY